MRHGRIAKGERAVLRHLAGCRHEGADRRARQRTADADALDAKLRQFGNREMHALQPHDDIDRPVDGGRDGADLIRRPQARREQNIGASLLIGLQPLDRVLQIAPPMQEILGPRRQHEIPAGSRAASAAARTRSVAAPMSKYRVAVLTR